MPIVLEDYFEFTEEPRAIRIKGHRIWLEHVIEQYQAGKTVEEIARYFPSLSREKIYATLLYYHHNREAMDDYMRHYRELGERMAAASDANPSPVVLRMRELKNKMLEEQERANAVSDR